jgi:hypothetical protein
MVHISVVGHLGWFQSLAIVNSAVMNISLQVSQTYHVLCVVSLDQMVVLSLIF